MATLMFLRSTLWSVSLSIILSTESTAIGAKTSELAETTLDERQVTQLLMRVYLSLRSTGTPIPSMTSLAFVKATLNPSEMAAAWIPF